MFTETRCFGFKPDASVSFGYFLIASVPLAVLFIIFPSSLHLGTPSLVLFRGGMSFSRLLPSRLPVSLFSLVSPPWAPFWGGGGWFPHIKKSRNSPLLAITERLLSFSDKYYGIATSAPANAASAIRTHTSPRRRSSSRPLLSYSLVSSSFFCSFSFFSSSLSTLMFLFKTSRYQIPDASYSASTPTSWSSSSLRVCFFRFVFLLKIKALSALPGLIPPPPQASHLTADQCPIYKNPATALCWPSRNDFYLSQTNIMGKLLRHSPLQLPLSYLPISSSFLCLFSFFLIPFLALLMLF